MTAQELKPTDLRLWNLIDICPFIGEKGIAEIVEILADSLTVKINDKYQQVLFDDCKPIPLTQNLILKCSAEFEKTSDTEFENKNNGGYPIYETDYDCPKPDGVPGHRLIFRIMKHDFGWFFILERNEDKQGLNIGTFYYFHQLQNILKDLTGNELTLNK